LASRVAEEHKSFAAFGRKEDSFSGRPVLIAAVPLRIQRLSVVHLQHITCRRGPQNRPPKRLLLPLHVTYVENDEGKRRNSQNFYVCKSQSETKVSLILTESTLEGYAPS